MDKLSDTNKVNIGLNVTRRCNLKCSFCFYNELHFVRDNANLELVPGIDLPLEDAYKKLSNYNISSIYIGGGEAFTYPFLKQLINWLAPRVEKIYISTNGILVTQVWIDYIISQKITLLVSVKDSSESAFRRLNNLHEAGVKIHIYHVLTLKSIKVLQSFSKRYYWAEKVRLLIETHVNPLKNEIMPYSQWFDLLKSARMYLCEIIDNVEIEMGYVDSKNSLALSPDRGAVNRIIIDVDLKMYPCPLLVENNNGKINGDFPNNCTHNDCPVFPKEASALESDFKQICPFVVTNLKSAVEYIYYNESMIKT